MAVRPSGKRRSPQPARHRALEIIAAHPGVCTEAILASQNIPADVLIELVRCGLATARTSASTRKTGSSR